VVVGGCGVVGLQVLHLLVMGGSLRRFEVQRCACMLTLLSFMVYAIQSIRGYLTAQKTAFSAAVVV
jgi:hypothetical protein